MRLLTLLLKSVAAAALLTLANRTAPAAPLRFDWIPPHAGDRNTLGTLRLPAGIAVSIAVQPAGEALVFQKAVVHKGDIHLAFSAGGEVEISSRVSGALFTADITASESKIAGLQLSPWRSSTPARVVTVPYYSQKVTYFAAERLFVNEWFDWNVSQATRMTANSVSYEPLTSGKRNRLRERLSIALAPDIDSVFPSIPNSASPYISQLAGKTVLDIWRGGSFASRARMLDMLGAAGVHDCVVLIHDWQHAGYDDALPGHVPANPEMGGDEGLREFVTAAKRMDCYAALHENYVDYYPDYEHFTKSAIALGSDGKPMLAWLNPGTHIQSFATKPTWFLRYADPEAIAIMQRFTTNAAFIDVNSSVLPWWRADMDAEVTEAGKFRSTVEASTSLWALERKTHDGPVFGEGSHHWFWSGFLDGVEAQLGAGGELTGPHAPLFVDFDLFRIHPLQVNHGMGYYSRWLPKGESITSTELMDAYRMQEVAFGHAPYVGDENLDDLSRVLVEQNVVGPVAARYGTVHAADVSYQVNGQWGSTNLAAAANEWSRVRVTYSNGDAITANAQTEPVSIDGFTLPQFGWIARGKNLLAYTALRQGALVDYAETATSIFANARNEANGGAFDAVAEPTMTSAKPDGSRAVQLQFGWQVFAPPQGDYRELVHFTDRTGKIIFQADHPPSVPTSQWKAGAKMDDPPFRVTVAANVPDGIYSLRVGLFPARGPRLPLLSWNDGERRYILGELIVKGDDVHFEARTQPRDARLNELPNPVDFGPIETDGIAWISRAKKEWSIRTYPAYRAVIVRLNTSRFPAPPVVTCGGESVHPHRSGNHWELHTAGAVCSWPAE